MKKSQSENKFSILKQLINGQTPVSAKNSQLQAYKTSRMFFISPSQLVSQSQLPDQSGFQDFDKSEDELSLLEQSIQVNISTNKTVNESKNNNDGTIDNNNDDNPASKLPKIAKNFTMDVQVIDSNKVKIEEDKPFPLKLLNSNLINDSLDYLKCDYSIFHKQYLFGSIKLPIELSRCARHYFCESYSFTCFGYTIVLSSKMICQPPLLLQNSHLFIIYLQKKLRDKLKTKYMKLFVLTKPPKDEIFEYLPYIIGKAVHLTIEKHIKNGKLIINNGDTENELYSFVVSEINGFQMSHVFLAKSRKKYLQDHDHGFSFNKIQKEDLKSLTTKRMPQVQYSSNVSQVNSSGINTQNTKKYSIQKRATIIKKQTGDLLTFKNELKRILMPPQDKKKQQKMQQQEPKKDIFKFPLTSRIQAKPNNPFQYTDDKKMQQTTSFQWFGGIPGDQSVMSQTARFNKFETGKLSPMFSSFYSTNSFTNPISKSNITLKKHITQSQERPESNFEILLRAYRHEKMHDIEEMKRNNSYKLKSSNIRTLHKILGKDGIPKQSNPDEFIIKRRERKWNIGAQISSDGNIYTSPGLQKLIELKQACDKVPTNFNFEKRVLNNMYQTRQSIDYLTKYNEIADKLLPEYREMLIQAQLENMRFQEEGGTSQFLSPEFLQRKLLQEKYEQKMKKILKRKNERLLRRQQEMVKEQQIKEKHLQNINNENEYQATIDDQFVKDEDVEFWFENIFHEYATEHILKKRTKTIDKPGLKPVKQLNLQSSFKKANPYQQRSSFMLQQQSPQLKQKPKLSSDNQYFKRQDLKYNGEENQIDDYEIDGDYGEEWEVTDDDVADDGNGNQRQGDQNTDQIMESGDYQ